ncbi:zinc-dependent peptidase [Aureivirga sp. CE67]|uniref:zinc-dependent peptidase n=1 Tax=Aureivirga sp. CE67 TaxID=1788983 RepID=UPI0018C9EDB7|nr:zinc-dependent peptidase [Aureivirga sp. CE67]
MQNPTNTRLVLRKNPLRIVLFPKRMKKSEKKIIAEKNEFYRKLKPFQKCLFEHRVLVFIKNHQFIGKDLKVTREMELLIAATAIMLTFGLDRYLYLSFDYILIYPDIYYSQLSKEKHKGEANPKYKVIVFSWKHFLEGFADNSDNLNLGIHELTHGLHFSFLKYRNYTSKRFIAKYKELLNFLKNKEEQRKILDSKYIRNYAFENQYEFLSVLVEHFFETPHQFQQKLPEIYGYLCDMFNMDTRVVLDD